MEEKRIGEVLKPTLSEVFREEGTRALQYATSGVGQLCVRQVRQTVCFVAIGGGLSEPVAWSHSLGDKSHVGAPVQAVMSELISEAKIHFGRTSFEITVCLDGPKLSYLENVVLQPINQAKYRSNQVRKINEGLLDLGEPKVFVMRESKYGPERIEVNYWKRGAKKYHNLKDILG